MEDETKTGDPAAEGSEVASASCRVKDDKRRGDCTGSNCEVCGGPSVLHFEEGVIVETCDPATGCGAAIAWQGRVIRKPSVDSIRPLVGTRFELGLIGKRNYERATGKKLPTGRQVKEVDPTDAESDVDVEAARSGRTVNSVNKAKAPKQDPKKTK